MVTRLRRQVQLATAGWIGIRLFDLEFVESSWLALRFRRVCYLFGICVEQFGVIEISQRLS